MTKREKLDQFLLNNCYKKKVKIPKDKEEFLTNDGHYLSLDTAKSLVRIGVSEQLGTTFKGKNKPVNFGFNAKAQEWVGFSHRAWNSFNIGYKVEKDEFICSAKGFKAGYVLKELEECKKAAKIFAEAVA